MSRKVSQHARNSREIYFSRWQNVYNDSPASCQRMEVACLSVSLSLWMLLFTNVVCCLGYRSNNFIVGLTNTDPAVNAPVLWNYTLCGQYPGTVPDGATVTVQCTNAYNRGLRFRYVIVQFPLINDTMNFCEIEVFTVGRSYNEGCTQDTYKFNKYKVKSNIIRQKLPKKQT